MNSRGVFSMMSNICDRDFYENSRAQFNFAKMIHERPQRKSPQTNCKCCLSWLGDKENF